MNWIRILRERAATTQALHASVAGELPPEAARSAEVSVRAMSSDADGRMAHLTDGSIGEASMFHATFGYDTQGVAETTAVLPQGWRDRLVRRALLRERLARVATLGACVRAGVAERIPPGE
ncbi:MAG TPA: hypothetical protein VNL18_07435 [Gemmatimonadales bacterium]|nr:hypothetical protein [Gemmatimonadales bacterium]